MTKVERPSAWLIPLWMVATVGGLFAGFVIPNLGQFVFDGYLAWFAFASIFFLPGLLVGFFQWLVIKPYRVGIGWMVSTAISSIVVILVASLVAVIPATSVHPDFREFLVFILAPAILGVPQSWQLRSIVIRPWYWLFISYVAWGILFLSLTNIPLAVTLFLGTFSFALSGGGMWWLLSNQAVAMKLSKPKNAVAKRTTRAKRLIRK